MVCAIVQVALREEREREKEREKERERERERERNIWRRGLAQAQSYLNGTNGFMNDRKIISLLLIR